MWPWQCSDEHREGLGLGASRGFHRGVEGCNTCIEKERKRERERERKVYVGGCARFKV